MLADWTPGRRIAVTAVICFCLAVTIITLARGLSADLPIRFVQVMASSATLALVAAMAFGVLTGRLSDYRETPEDEEGFERMVRESERLAAGREPVEEEEVDWALLDPRDPYDFEEIIRHALDELPDVLLRSLDRVAVVISDDGRRENAYGLYQGDTVASDGSPDRIVIFRDTLVRDFGDDPEELRHQVTRTVRHELAHHLGADELGVRDLGL